MKKFLGMMLVAILLISSLAVTAFAADNTYTVTFSVENNPGFGAYGIWINYDPTGLELISINGGTVTPNITANTHYGVGQGFVAFANATKIYDNGSLFTATFKVKDTAVASKTYNVTAELDRGNGYIFGITVTGGAITAPACTHAHTTTINAKDATCTEEGYTGDTWCSDCNTVIANGTTISKVAHDYDSEVTLDPTCTEDGVRTYTCKNCPHSYTETINATGHTWDNGKVTTAATCTKNGVMTYTCHCGATKTETIKATGHHWDNGKITKPATCTETGFILYTCQCGATEIGVIGPIPHQYKDGKCVYCGRDMDTEEEEVIIPTPVESDTEEVDEDTANAPETTPEESPKTGVALAILPMVVAAAAVMASKRR